VGTLENCYFGRYVKFLKESEGQLEARRILLGVRGGRRIFFSESIKHSTVQSFLRDALRYKDTGRLLSYTGDELRWEIDVPVKGYLSFIDNWDSNWKAFVDNNQSEIELLFGTFKSVAIVPGRHIVRFSYEPGMRTLFGSIKRRVGTTNETN
jgi:sulfur relay (sulfurtransferase) DsrC/TusE family protein